MNQQDLYKFTLEYLKTQLGLRDPQFDIMRVVHGVDDIARRASGQVSQGGYFLNNGQHDMVNEIVWDLIVQRIITISDTQGYAWLRITEYGKRIIESNEITPYDRDGYIASIKHKAPKISTLALDYIQEAMTCFRSGAQRAASVMLGVASEEIFSDMIRSFEKKYSKNILPSDYKPFKQVKDLFGKSFEPLKKDLPQDLKNNIDNTIGGIYELIKKMRDDSGHPTDAEISRDEVYANFLVLPLYAERIYKVVNFYENN